MNIQLKIKEYIKLHGISFREFAKMCGLPNSTLQSICERGIYSASYQNACKIASVMGVLVSDFSTVVNTAQFSQREISAIEKFRTIDERSRNTVEALLDHEVAVCKNASVLSFVRSEAKSPAEYIEISKRKPQTRLMKIFMQPAAAGYGNYVDDDSFEEIELENVPASADFGVRIAGDSMQPQICDGDIAFVKKQETLLEGEIGIYVIDGDAFCKKLIKKGGKFYLHSLNPKYQDFILPQEAYLVGKVVK